MTTMQRRFMKPEAWMPSHVSRESCWFANLEEGRHSIKKGFDLRTETTCTVNPERALFCRGWQNRKVLGSPTDRQNYLTYRQCSKNGILMPENPTDGDSRQAESRYSVTTYSTRTKSKGSLGAGGQTALDRNQDQWITGSRANQLDPDQDQGITARQSKTELDPDQNQRITGRRVGSAGSTRTKSSGSLRAHGRKGKTGGDRGRTVEIQKLSMLQL